MNKTPEYDFSSVLKEMRDEYWRGLEEAEPEVSTRTKDYLVFSLGGERFGIPLSAAREVVRAPRVVRVPKAPPRIAGVINLRGAITAVTDLRDLLGLGGQGIPEKARMIVVEGAGITTALLTDGVEGMRCIAEQSIEPPTAGISGIPRELVEGQISDDKGILVLLRMDRVLSREDMRVDQKGE